MFTAKTLAAILAAASLAIAAPAAQGSYYGSNGGSSYSGSSSSSSSSAVAAPTGVTATSTYSTGGASKVAPVNPNQVTHRVTAGFNGLNFEPKNIVANVGDIVEFKFLPKNHSVAQSSFDQPCKPLTDNYKNQVGFFAGFDFVTADNKLAPDVFQIVVKDTKPTWFYCPQTVGNHCQMGMAGVINQDFSSNDKTLDKYIAAARLTGTSIVPSHIQGGAEFLNPNPLSGFP